MNYSLRVAKAARVVGGRPVLRGIDLALEDGMFLVLAGESGSGKTTALRMIAGLDRADAGSIEINGGLMDDAKRVFVPAARRNLGMVFQDFAFWPHLSCLENVAFALPAGAAKREAAAMALLDRLGVAALARRRPAQLSGGQQQRVGIARALAPRPKLLLLDEPFSSLDLATREHLREALRESVQAAGISALLVSHDPEDCWKFADRVAVLEAGVIRQYGTPRTLWDAPASPYIARFTGALGDIPVPVLTHCGAPMLAFGDQTLVLSGKAPGSQIARLFWRDDAITPMPEGRYLAEAVSVNFKAGRFWVRWRLPGWAATLSGYTAMPVALGRQRIEIDAGKIFLFDDSGAPCI
jgi:iron(III) transport system ATP-binding protein